MKSHEAMGTDAPGKVLIVDDDDVQLLALRAWLESAGYEVVTHNGPVGASAVLYREQPDFVVLDFMMPGLTGDALARIFARQSEQRRLRIVFFSAADPATIRAMTRDLPVLGAIRKTHDGSLFLNQFRGIVSGSGRPPSKHPRP